MLKHYASNLLVDMNLEAKKSTLEYIKANMVDAPYFEKHPELVRHALSRIEAQGLNLEFGVGRGKSMRWIAPNVDGKVHGFDSFEGIQEHWNGNPIGAFAQKQMPKVPTTSSFTSAISMRRCPVSSKSTLNRSPFCTSIATCTRQP